MLKDQMKHKGELPIIFQHELLVELNKKQALIRASRAEVRTTQPEQLDRMVSQKWNRCGEIFLRFCVMLTARFQKFGKE